MLSRFKICLILLLIVSGFVFPVKAQDGGVGSVFHYGVGARQMALGGAVVAHPYDATTIYWNPAGMEYITNKNLTMFHTSFLEGTTYNYFGMVYPTLYIGTFGIGVTRISTGDVIRRFNNIDDNGEIGYDQSEFYLSYAKIIRSFMSVGANIKLHRQSINDLTDAGLGVDLSIMYLPNLDFGLLRNVQLGINLQNAIRPRLNPGEATDYIPTRVLVGLSRSFYLGFDQNPLVLMFALDKSEKESMVIRSGIEYSYQGKGMVRMGLDQNGVAFGAGASYGKFQMDYGYGRLAEGEFGGGHRFSITFKFGKSRDELLEIAEQQRQMEISERVALEQEKERKATIARLLDEGNAQYGEADYSYAEIKFRQVLELDPNNPEAQEMIDESVKRMKEIRSAAMEEQLSKIEDIRTREQTKNFVERHMNLGEEFLLKKDYNAALNEFQIALDRQPENQAIKDRITSIRDELNAQISNLIKQADDLARKGNYSEAIRMLNNAQLLSQNDETRLAQITQRIGNLEGRIDVLDNYQRGLTAYGNEDWSTALQYFTRARKLDANYSELPYFYREAERRANAREEAMTPEMEKRFTQAYMFYLDNKIQEAIDIWKELLEIQPYNKQIIENIDKAQKELDRLKRLNNRQQN